MKARNEILEELKAISPVLGNLPEAPGYQVPDGYFSGFPDIMLEKVMGLDETDTLSPLLAGLRSKPVFTVPDGYFERFSQNVISDLQPAPTPAKVIRMRPQIFKRMMAAAAVAGLLFLGGWFFLQSPQKVVNPVVAKKLIPISDKALHDQAHVIPESELMSYLDSSRDLEDEDEPMVTPDASEDLASLMLVNVSDEDLQNYLDQTYAF